MDGPSTLPVTTHFLKPHQRVRLMRSTRKVEHLLGETPLFVDTSSPITPTFPGPQSRRTAAYIYVAPVRSSSLNAYAPPDPSYTSTSRVPARPLLAVSVPAPVDMDPPIASPASISFPTQPKSPADEERRQRTRKMARIARTLGENVPAELVFPATLSPKPRRTSTLTKRRSSRLVRASSAASRAGRRDSLTKGELEKQGADAAALESIESDSESASVYSTLSGGDWERVPYPHPPNPNPNPTHATTVVPRASAPRGVPPTFNARASAAAFPSRESLAPGAPGFG
ncbi:hypothetical protein MVEN_00922800 [Mycena venus]|uniref:Uncharacterized protein n=1 Tax=Mycena venus TaxID=2733690 RepID=A0A8H6YC01_9AGAR|nr:hypothetical protein MVEN_00922800 [Mycena venus]